ncbi:hypothetical protein KK062_05765 [Fulvivirgaceae bacterium PWU5]|uniref:Uncharacterized protein n=1 Tax=Dawidia cretensis TaxID=2782350 RepID=A0AAP2DUM7_9BACT|nr:hypothetical protein [Dawidia cretensis]MBT1707716.1 hypothetical protein [Dawidia cretensis]
MIKEVVKCKNGDNGKDRSQAQKLLINYYDSMTGDKEYFSMNEPKKQNEVSTKLAMSFFEGFFSTLGSVIGGLANRFF